MPSEFKYAPYSPSKFKTFDECPRAFEYRYIKRIKILKEPVVWFEKGTFIHWVLEHYPIFPEGGFTWELAGKDLRKEWTELAMDIVKNPHVKELLRNRIKAEQKIALDENFKPKNSDGWDHFMVGFADYIGRYDNGQIVLIDWKTGKSIVKDDNQLKLYALWMLVASPEIDQVNSAFYYLEQDKVDEYCYFREELDEYKSFFINKIDEIECCTDFVKKPTKRCTNCDYVDRCKPFKPKFNLSRTKS